MARRGRVAYTVAFLLLVLAQGRPSQARDDEDDGSFGMTAPVACGEIRGYLDYDELTDAALTSEDKLLVYFMPRHYKTAPKGDKYQAHFVQDCKLRRRGQKSVLWEKSKILDYTAVSDMPPREVYLKNTISVKGLKPGDYEYDIVLRDKIGESEPAVRTLRFTVVPVEQKLKDPGETKTKSPSVR